ncbi:MAG: SusE domain-containing protein, partial [Bacteroidia bacterium]|nr:SusE domain-containing protein [Bacteroidia bacterium]MCF8447665.1 SusE domain-containing protein [Bacteroidia bacterium]
ASGVIDMEDILGAGNFLIVDQAHYSIPGALVEGGQLLKLYNPATANGIAMKTIAEAREVNPNDTVRVQGIVTRAWGRFIYIQDSTGAIGVRQSSGAMVDSIVSGGIMEGDLVEVVAPRSNFNNYAQLAIATGAHKENNRVTVLAHNQTMPKAKKVTLKEINENGEMYESQLVKVVDLRTASTGNFLASTNYTIWDGTTPGDTMLLRVISGADTEIDDAPGLAIPSSKFTFEGTLIQFCATPTTGCTIGYQLQGVRKYEITAQPADPTLSAFDLLSPSNNARVEVETGSTNPIQISWRKSNNAISYKWFATTATGSFASPIVVMPSNNAGTDSILTLSSGSVDALLVSLGVARGDSALVKWTVFAYQNTGDSLKASQDFNVNLVRKRLLQGFGLISPANNTRLEVEESDNTPVNITWQTSAPGATYKWFVDVPTGDFSNPWAALASDVSGTATQLSLTSGIIDNLLASKSVADGDSVNLQWTVRAYTSNDSLQANSIYAIKVVRKKAVGIKEVSSRFSFQLYPNPTSENAVLVIESLSKETVQVQLSDIQGKLIGLPIEQVIENGKQTIQIPSAGLPNGLYFINITSEGKSSQVKLVVMH